MQGNQGLFLKWIEQAGLARETGIDCGNCLVGIPAKCCDFFPFFPNYVVGRVLESRDAEIGERVAVAIAKGGATPLGIFAPEGFSGLCPFYRDSKCSIWSERPGVCRSYHCRSSRGEAGLRDWASIKEKMNLFEWTLAHEALWRLGFTQDEIRRGEWSEFRGSEIELYRLAAERVREIDETEVARLMGSC